MNTDEPLPHDAAPIPWRVGRSLGRTIYDANDQLLGLMEHPDLAASVCIVMNAVGVGALKRLAQQHIDQLRTALRLIGPDEITPTGIRILESICEEWESKL